VAECTVALPYRDIDMERAKKVSEPNFAVFSCLGLHAMMQCNGWLVLLRSHIKEGHGIILEIT